MKTKFDYELKKEFKDIAVIEYGVIEGNNTVVFIKVGQDGSHIGYNNKYVKMASMINNKYGCTVITSSNPFDGNNPLDNDLEVIDDVMMIKEYEIYYLGFSNGGIIGLQFGTNYEKIKKIISVNAPLMINYHKTKDGILKFKGKELTLVYGSKDQSFRYVPLLDGIDNSKMKVVILENEDHHISRDSKNFYSIPDLFFKEM